jgi:hypothetical protein
MQLAIAGMALTYGVKVLVDTVTELRDEVTAITAQIAAAQLHLAQAAPYPAAEDLDPLERANGTSRYPYAETEDEAKARYAARQAEIDGLAAELTPEFP